MVLPQTWVGDGLSSRIDKEAERTRVIKLRLVNEKRGDLDLSGFFVDLNDATITEYLSSVVASSCDKKLLDFSPILQAMITYRVSAYDFIQDNHCYKLGKPTILKTHGRDYVEKLMEVYNKTSVVNKQFS